MSNDYSYLDRLDRLAKQLGIESFSILGTTIGFDGEPHVKTFSIGIAKLTFEGKSNREPAFTKILNRLAKFGKRPTDVLAISAHNLDELTVIDRIEPDHECESLETPLLAAGGSGANTAYALARLGAKVRVAGIVGNDASGGMLREDFHQAQADTSLLLTHPGLPTGKTTTLVDDDGKRLIVVYPGVNNHYAQAADEEALLKAALSSRILHLSSFVGESELELQRRLVQKVGARCLISLTPGALYAREGLDSLESILRHVDIMFLYREQLATLLDKSSRVKVSLKGGTSRELIEAYFRWRKDAGIDAPTVVVVKDPLERSGGKIKESFLSVGAGYDSVDHLFSPLPIKRNARVFTVDTTGAGDAAAAGFLFKLLLSKPLDICIDSGFLLACFTSKEIGARTAFVSSDDQPSCSTRELPDDILPKLPRRAST